MKEHGICAKCKKSVGCPYADDRIKGCKKFVLEDELELTNEQYIRTCSTEELAKLIYKIAVTDVLMDRFFTAEVVNAGIVDVDSGIKEAEAWLKEKHE